ncbi:class I SAM-dependent methyltransferase [Paenibacillus albicereus]|uniref:Class I SAM-dependent methyltransferase n=1 Tax=Paenibacillus albicereus TaxID=2726185 RepID=A0A6H2GXE6_9BACL|nr:class I SAM-dependent methyltransferase [Paenibacillus albicereus]QJC52075.1 class I SAM-dependent methyltransferase [Paenibacillus albicereus]
MGASEFEQAREAEKDYHEKLYEERDILEPGSWMSKPLPFAMELLEKLLADHPSPVVLDLGSGPGRNAIPIAQRLQEAGNGRIVGTDLLEQAVEKLKENAAKFGVEDRVQAIQADVEQEAFEAETYDYVLACGCLEHVSSEDALLRVIRKLQEATRPGGMHGLSMNTDLRETVVETGEELPPQIELKLSEDQTRALLEQAYEGWEVLLRSGHEVEIEEDKYDEPTEFKARNVVFAARKPCSIHR